MTKQFLGETEVVSISDNTVTFKGGEQVEMTPQMIRHCITDKKTSPEELKSLKTTAFQMYVMEAYDTLGMTEMELKEGIDLVFNTLSRQKQEAILTAFGKDPDSTSVNAFYSFTYQDIKKFLR